MNSATSRSRRPAPSCCSRSLASAANAAPSSSPSNLPFDEWTSVFASERLTGALLDRLTHHVHILEMNGDSFRLKHIPLRQGRASFVLRVHPQTQLNFRQSIREPIKARTVQPWVEPKRWSRYDLAG